MSPLDPQRDEAPFNHAELADRCLGRLDLVTRILDRFLTQFEGDLSELETALRAEDAPTVTRLAHRLKGASANVAAPRLRQKAEKMEQLASHQRLEELPTRFAELQTEWWLFREYLAASGESAGT